MYKTIEAEAAQINAPAVAAPFAPVAPAEPGTGIAVMPAPSVTPATTPAAKLLGNDSAGGIEPVDG